METDVSHIEQLRRDGHSFKEISTLIGRSTKFAWKHSRYVKFSDAGKQRYHKEVTGILKQMLPQTVQLSIEKARIISHLLFDGTLFTNNYHYVTGYINSSDELVEEFIKDMFKVYGLSPSSLEREMGKSLPYTRVKYNSKSLYTDLLRYTPSYSTSSDTSFIPYEIINSNDETKSEILRAFWEDEGSISKCGRLSADSKSKKIILQLENLHKQFGLSPKICKYKVYTGIMYKLYLPKADLEKFYKLGFFKLSVVSRGSLVGQKKIDVLKSIISN